VGRVVECADGVSAPAVGQLVYGIWGHRADAVLPADVAARRMLPDGVPPEWGVFARVGAIALNAVVAADIHLGEHVAVFGQGVIGVLATRLATLNGAAVTAVDAKPARLDLARTFGAVDALDARSSDGVAESVRAATDGFGADTAIELSGSYAALQEAVRTVRPGGRVVAAGFYQGDAVGLRLGEEFHHNRVEIVASQIGGVPRGLTGQWDHHRLLRVFMTLVAEGRVDVAPLISHVLEVGRVGDAFALLDEQSDDALQVILRFGDVEGDAR
jgi:threonine dehydrogenase-like Zn-dependent dehydrogenase